VASGWGGLNFDATVGAFVFGPAILLTLANLLWSYRKNVPCEANPWDAKEMEWTGAYKGSADLAATQTKSALSEKGEKHE
jgi:heme/copper-type cytochrome/quinol oxidase subunit 1